MYKWDKRVLCPYCAYEGFTLEFRLKSKTGYSHSKKQCPDCKVIMFKQTLEMTLTVSEWATWLYSGCRTYYKDGNAFFHKIKFKKLFSRLKQYGMSYEFWGAWREAKEMSSVELRKILNKAYRENIKQIRLAPFKPLKMEIIEK